ncbi:MAG: hypothetical protein ABIR70_11490 [Bryobacteraceae bacterium]
MKNPQFLAAMGLYALLAFAAWRTLDQEFLWVTWIILGVFAVKTLLVVLKRRLN